MPHITFIHGIANKPPSDLLAAQWRGAMTDGGFDLESSDVSSSMVYWADVLYKKPLTNAGGNEANADRTETVADDEDMDWAAGLDGREAEFVASLREKLGVDVDSPTGNDDYVAPAQPQAPTPGASTSDNQFEAIPLPWFIKRRLMKVAVRDVHHYLFNTDHSPRPGTNFRVRDHVRQLFVDQLASDATNNIGGKHIVVGHSMGTVIAYDCLKHVAACPSIDHLFTLGSPLGLSEVQDNFEPPYRRDNAYPESAVTVGWKNYYDRLDPVSLDARIANDYRLNGGRIVDDIRVQNFGVWKHNVDRYLAQSDYIEAVRDALAV